MRGSDEAEHRDRPRNEARLVHDPAQQEGVEGRDAGPEDEGPIADGDECVLDADQQRRLGARRTGLLKGHDRQDADDADHEHRALEQPRADETDREALVLPLDHGVERNCGADGGEAVDDVEEGAEAHLGVGAQCRR